ncbi:hypothetical protein Tco_0693650 [Tanacetum coccineum]
MSRNHQKVPIDYFFNNDLKYLQGAISNMTYTTFLTKTKAAQYDLPGIEDMVLNIWVSVKFAYDKHALWGISHWREKCKSFYRYVRVLQSRHDVYSTKRILAVTQVEVMKKHGYGYLKEIVVRRADNDLYRLKEGDFPRLRINDIKDMLLLVVQNWLINLLGDDIFNFAIALRMFTRSLVLHKKRDPYTPYQDPKGFIYVYTLGRNRLMRSDKLSKFSDRTLTGLRTLMDDITKNIQIEYLPKRHWSTLEKKRANIIIKAIDKQLKETRSKSKNKGKVPTEMELVLEQTQQVLERFNTSAGNPVKDILLKLSLPVHWSILTYSKVTPTKHGRMTKPYSSPRFIANCFISGTYKDGRGGTWFQQTQRFITACSYSIDIYKDIMKAQVHVSRLPLLNYYMSFWKRRSVKVKELQDKLILKAFKLSYQEKYEHVGPKSQDH